MGWMRDHDWNQGRLAKQLGQSRAHTSRMLSGKAPIDLTTAVKLADLTGIAAQELVTDQAALRRLKTYLGRQKADRRSSKETASVV